MAAVVGSDGVSLIRLRHVERKADGSYQYRRRVPVTLAQYYGSRRYVVCSLGRNNALLIQKCYKISEQIESEWRSLGWSKKRQDSILPVLFPRKIDYQHDRENSNPLSGLNLSEAFTLYLKMHPRGRQKKLASDCERVRSAVVKCVGDLPIEICSRVHAERFRDSQLGFGSTAYVRRQLSTLVAVFNRVIKEKQLRIHNPFECLGIIGEGEDGTKRVPFTDQELGIVSLRCRNLNDDIRFIVALQLDTGCRVAEIVGLRVDDVVLDHFTPHIRIRPWGKVRTLKTTASERDIPLVGEALWAAGRAMEAHKKAADGCPWLFPRYASDREIKASHASSALNKWLRSLDGVSSDKTTHCFRHAMRDRLRAAQVPHDIQDAIGGWGTRTIGQGYGNGYPITVLAEHMRKVV